MQSTIRPMTSVGYVSTSGTENVITKQPYPQRQLKSSDQIRAGQSLSTSTVKVKPMPTFDDDMMRRPTGLASLAVSDTILIQISPNCFSCDWDQKYDIYDDGLESILMFTAIEELQCCSCGSLQNIVIRDPNDVPVARVCYKEKSWLTGKLAMAVYAPPDLLIGTVEEFNHFGLCCSPRFILRNSETENICTVEYYRNACPGAGSKFLIQANDGNSELARIVNKTQNLIRLHFATKTNITVKMILLGFCLGILHKSYKQEFREPSGWSRPQTSQADDL